MPEEPTYATYVLAVVVFAMLWGALAYVMSAWSSQLMTAYGQAYSELTAAANKSGVAVGKTPFSSAASSLSGVVNWLASVISNPLTLAVLVALSLMLSAYYARKRS